MAVVQPLAAEPSMLASQPSFPRPPRSTAVDGRFTGRRWIPNGRNNPPVRPSTSGWSSDRGARRAGADPWLVSKLAAMPPTTRGRARAALVKAHAARTPAPRRREIVTPRSSYMLVAPRGKPNDMLLPPTVHDWQSSRPASRQPVELLPITLPGAGKSMDSADDALKMVGNRDGAQMAKVSHAGQSKQPLLVGRRSRTAELLGLSSMGAPLAPTVVPPR